MSGPKPPTSFRPEPRGPAIWAHRRPPKRTIPVKVHCEKRYGNGKQNCRVDVKLFSSDERRWAELEAKRLISGRRRPNPKPQKVDPGKETPGNPAAATAVAVAPAFGETLFGGGAAAAEGTAVAGGTSIGVSAVLAPAIGAAAVFNPGQAKWNEQNPIVRFGVEEEFDITIHVVAERGDAPLSPRVSQTSTMDGLEDKEVKPLQIAQPDVASTGDPNNLPGGNNKKPIEPPPEKKYRTWKQIASDIYNNVKRPHRIRRSYDWLRPKFRWGRNDKNPTRHDPIEYEPGLNWFQRRWVDMRRGFRETAEGQIEHWRDVASRFKGGLRTARKIRRHPLGEFFSTLNRPGKLWNFLKFTLTTGYALLRVGTALVRRLTGSEATNPVGSELFGEESEPYVGIFGSGVIGASIEHYIFGWKYLPSFIFSAAWGAGEMLVQDSASATGDKDTDWVRSDLATATGAALWGPTAFLYRWGKAAFPGKRWEIFLTDHPFVDRLLGWVPRFLAPKRIPTFNNTLFTLLTTRLYINTLPTLFGAVAEDANMAEYYKVTNTRLWTTDLFLQWFAMAWDPYLRTGSNIAYTALTVFQSKASSQYFQIWKGENLYREPLKRLPNENADFSVAMKKLNKALGVKDLNVDNFLEDLGLNDSPGTWSPVPEEWYDFFKDIDTGYFTHKDINYFSKIANSKPPYPTEISNQVQSALRIVLHTYANSAIPHEWPNGVITYEQEEKFRADLKDRITTNETPSHSARTKKEFLKKIEEINNPHQK